MAPKRVALSAATRAPSARAAATRSRELTRSILRPSTRQARQRPNNAAARRPPSPQVVIPPVVGPQVVSPAPTSAESTSRYDGLSWQAVEAEGYRRDVPLAAIGSLDKNSGRLKRVFKRQDENRTVTDFPPRATGRKHFVRHVAFAGDDAADAWGAAEGKKPVQIDDSEAGPPAEETPADGLPPGGDSAGGTPVAGAAVEGSLAEGTAAEGTAAEEIPAKEIPAKETPAGAPNTDGDEAFARRLEKEERERRDKEAKEAKKQRDAREERNAKRARQLQRERRFGAATGLSGPLWQLDVTGDGHCLYRAFGVAYYAEDSIVRGERDQAREAGFRLLVRARLRRWWDTVTQQRNSEESRSRLGYYRALNAVSARDPGMRGRMDDYTVALRDNYEAYLGYSPTLLQDRTRGAETVAWQIDSSDNKRVWGTLDTVQVLADAFDVEVIIHIPRLNGDPPDIESWETLARGRPGARQVHIIQWMSGVHWTAAAPVEQDTAWTANLPEESRLPAFGSNFPGIQDTVPPELPVAIRYTGSDAADDGSSTVVNGSSTAGRRSPSNKRPSPEADPLGGRQPKQPKIRRPPTQPSATSSEETHSTQQAQPAGGMMGSEDDEEGMPASDQGIQQQESHSGDIFPEPLDKPTNQQSASPAAEDVMAQRMNDLLNEAREELEREQRERQEAESPVQSTENASDYHDPATGANRTSQSPEASDQSQYWDATSDLTRPSRPTQQQQPPNPVTRPTISPVSPQRSPPATTDEVFRNLVGRIGLERALQITQGEAFIEDSIIELPEPPECRSPEHDPFVSGIRSHRRWRDHTRLMRNQEPYGANSAANGLLPEDAISDTSQDETLALIPVRDFETGEVLDPGREGRIAGKAADQENHPVEYGEMGVSAEIDFGPFSGNRSHWQHRNIMAQRAATRRRLRRQQRVQEGLPDVESDLDEDADRDDEAGNAEGEDGDTGGTDESSPQPDDDASRADRESSEETMIERPDAEAEASAPNGAAIDSANGDNEVYEQLNWDDFINESGGQEEDISQVAALQAAAAAALAALDDSATAPVQPSEQGDDDFINLQQLE